MNYASVRQTRQHFRIFDLRQSARAPIGCGANARRDSDVRQGRSPNPAAVLSEMPSTEFLSADVTLDVSGGAALGAGDQAPRVRSADAPVASGSQHRRISR